MKSTIALSIAVLGFTVLTQSAHAYGDGAQSPSRDTSSTLTRAEVQADLALWRRAGLLALSDEESFDPGRPDAARRIALYQQWRDGTAYRAELAKEQGRSTTAQAAPVPKAP